MGRKRKAAVTVAVEEKVKKSKVKKPKVEEIEDSPEKLEAKCTRLAKLLSKSRCTIVYTGAGLSTSASIPDYRGPNGIWTMAEAGSIDKFNRLATSCDPTKARPTYSHMALRELYARGHVRHVLSQNCDGLHMRSGLPQSALSEIHGNMYIEVCTHCSPHRQYIRTFDVTEKTRYRQHKTARRCDRCHNLLIDTIIHFGEQGKLTWPLNWKGAVDILEEECCELILILGSSLKILSKYGFLWPTQTQRKHGSRKIVIVNLQETSKDKVAHLKINGKCDEVMSRVMDLLQANTPDYCHKCDPINSTKRRQSHTSQIMTKIVSCSCEPSADLQSTSTSISTFCDSPLSLDSAFDTTETADGTSATTADTTEATTKRPGWWTAGFTSVLSGKKRKKARGKPGAFLKKLARDRRKLKEVEQQLVDDVEECVEDLVDVVCA